MKTRWLVCVLLGASVSICNETQETAGDLLRQSLAAMGGEGRVRGLAAPHLQTVAEGNALEQPERPEGPYIVENDQAEQWRDLAHGHWRRTAKLHIAIQPEFVMTAVVSGGAASLAYNGQPVPASGEQLQEESAQTSDPILGTWSGQLRHDGETQRMTLRFALDDKKSLVVTFDQPEMKFYNLGPGPVEKQGDRYKAPPMSFRLKPDGKKIIGTMSFDGNDLAFELVPGTAPFPEAPKPFEGRIAQPVWAFKTHGAIWSSPAVDGSSVYFGSNDGNIYALEADNGKRLWEKKTGGWVMGRPTIDGEYLYALSDDGFLYKLEKKTGKTVWQFDTHGAGVKRDMPPNASALDCLGAAATVAGGTVYIGSADKNFYAADAKTGREKWHFETKDIIRSTPAVVQGAVYFGSGDHNVYALDARTGTLKWKVDTVREVVSSPLVVNGTVYIGSRSSNLYALDAATGQVKWKFFYWTSFVDSSAVIRDGILYVGSSDYQKLFAINATDGKRVWDFDTEGSSWSTPAVTDKLVYVGAVGSKTDYMTHYGTFFAVERFTGKLVWRYPMSELSDYPTYGVASSPAADLGLVFFGGLNGMFYAFRQEG